jgi:hypothetical protein
MIRRHGAKLVALVLTGLVATACIVRSRGPGRTVYREAPHEKHHDNGKHRGDPHRR